MKQYRRLIEPAAILLLVISAILPGWLSIAAGASALIQMCIRDRINTYTALVLACTTSALPLSILVLKGFFDTVSATIEEAATIDGAGRFQTLFTIVIPLIKPGIVAVGLYSFLVCWDDFLWSLTPVSYTHLLRLRLKN